jgi:hypothetical protein
MTDPRITGWKCDKCGQALGGPDDRCNSGIHQKPGEGNDAETRGRAIPAVPRDPRITDKMVNTADAAFAAEAAGDAEWHEALVTALEDVFPLIEQAVIERLAGEAGENPYPALLDQARRPPKPNLAHIAWSEGAAAGVAATDARWRESDYVRQVRDDGYAEGFAAARHAPTTGTGHDRGVAAERARTREAVTKAYEQQTARMREQESGTRAVRLGAALIALDLLRDAALPDGGPDAA